MLFILRSGPRSGAEIMDDMERMSQGWWRPSPGSVYPLLEELENEKLVSRLEDGRYKLSALVRDEFGFGFTGGPRNVGDAVAELSGLVSYLEDLRATELPELAAASPRLEALAGRLHRLATAAPGTPAPTASEQGR